jgi:hypothetical protein
VVHRYEGLPTLVGSRRAGKRFVSSGSFPQSSFDFRNLPISSKINDEDSNRLLAPFLKYSTLLRNHVIGGL